VSRLAPLLLRFAAPLARLATPVLAGGLITFGVTSSVHQGALSTTVSIRVAGETAASVTLSWDPVAAADGFAFYRDSRRLSHTLDGTRTSVKFGKPDARPHTYSVAVIQIEPKQSVTIPAPAPSSAYAPLAQNVIFTAWNPNAALRAPPKWRIAVSADPSFDAAARAAASTIKAQGHLLAVWGNQSQIGAQRIRDFGAQVGADYLIFQAETSYEYDDAIAAGAHVIIGNPNSMTAAQRADATSRINAGQLAFIFETYTNEGDPWPAASSAGGVPVSSLCPGVGWGRTPYQLPDYKPNTPAGAWPLISLYLAETMNDASWSAIP